MGSGGGAELGGVSRQSSCWRCTSWTSTAGTGRRHDHPFLALEGPAGVFIAALPVLAHRGAGELVILGVTLIGFLLINNVQNGDLRKIGKFVEPAPVVLAQLILRHLFQRLSQHQFQIMDAAVDVGGVARAGRVDDVLVARHHACMSRATRRAR